MTVNIFMLTDCQLQIMRIVGICKSLACFILGIKLKRVIDK